MEHLDLLPNMGRKKKISKYSSVLATVSVGVPTGVILKIKITRSTQSFIFPIHLSEEIVPAAIFYASVTPLLVWLLVRKSIIEPMNESEKQKNIDKAKETNKQRMAEKKKEAEAAVELMAALYERICIDEKNKKGLIIIKAAYGKFSENEIDEDTSDDHQTLDLIIEVTVPLQCLIRDSKLKLQQSSKSELIGFYDPCVGEDKQLKVDYIYNETNYSVTISDRDELQLPKSELND